MFKFDVFLLRQFDTFVEWFWNEFEVNKLWLLRGLGVLYAVAFFLAHFFDHTKTIEMAVLITIGAIWFSIIEGEERKTPCYRNSIRAQVREIPVSRGIRLLITALSIFYVGSSLYYFEQFIFLLIVYTSCAITPKDPPKRKLRALVLAPLTF